MSLLCCSASRITKKVEPHFMCVCLCVCAYVYAIHVECKSASILLSCDYSFLRLFSSRSNIARVEAFIGFGADFAV